MRAAGGGRDWKKKNCLSSAERDEKRKIKPRGIDVMYPRKLIDWNDKELFLGQKMSERLMFVL